MERKQRKVRIGTVVSDAMDKTAVVEVHTDSIHHLYGKHMDKSNRFKVHDEKNECGIGDTVRIMETRPLSKNKRWRLVDIVKKAE